MRARKKTQTEPPAKLHPSLQDAEVPLQLYNFEHVERDYLSCAIWHCINDLVYITTKSSRSVKISRQSPIDAAQLSLQCRATEKFAPRGLVLIPGNAWIDLLLHRKPEESEHAALRQKKKPAIHKSMVPKVCGGSILQSLKDGRIKSMPERPAVPFELTSPLVKKPAKRGEEIDTASVHPFWAVIRCMGSKSIHNMEMTLESFVLPHATLKGLDKPPALQTTVTLPVYRNIVAVDENDILTLRWEPNEDDEE